MSLHPDGWDVTRAPYPTHQWPRRHTEPPPPPPMAKTSHEPPPPRWPRRHTSPPPPPRWPRRHTSPPPPPPPMAKTSHEPPPPPDGQDVTRAPYSPPRWLRRRATSHDLWNKYFRYVEHIGMVFCKYNVKSKNTLIHVHITAWFV